MKSTLSRMAAVVLAMWLGFAAGTANATVQTINNWNNDGGGFSANFGNNVLTSFEDSIHFSLPKVGSSNNVSLTHDGGTSLEAFELWGDGNKLSSGIIGSSDSHLSFLGDSNIKDFELRFKGHNYSGGGSYCGNIVISPVPEPQTYAMLLIGLGLVGFSARRRKNDTVD